MTQTTAAMPGGAGATGAETSTQPILQVDGLAVSFDNGSGPRIQAVDGVRMAIYRRQTLAVVGESGCGKSMTALSLLRLLPRGGKITSGQVVLDSRNLLELSIPEMYEVRGHEMSMIFQEPMTSLNPVIRVGDQVVEAVVLHEKVSIKAARERGIELFKRVGIPDPEARFDTFPHQMSGGLKQRVMIAMALVTRPKVLLADEPTTALDVTIQAQIIQLLRELQRDFSTAVLLITHDLGVVNQIADEIAVMYAGRIVEQGARHHLLTEPQHPYTQGLLGALPGRSGPKQRLVEIQGNVPSPRNWPSGCRFHPRCGLAHPPCERVIPALSAGTSEPTKVACYAVHPEENA